jgi:hypothetical protein
MQFKRYDQRSEQRSVQLCDEKQEVHTAVTKADSKKLHTCTFDIEMQEYATMKRGCG